MAPLQETVSIAVFAKSALSASDSCPEMSDDKALLVELRQPHLIGDVDVEPTGPRQRVLGELLADVVVRNGVERDLDTGRLGELGGMFLVEFVVGRAGLRADRDLAAGGASEAQRTSAEVRTRHRLLPFPSETVCDETFFFIVFLPFLFFGDACPIFFDSGIRSSRRSPASVWTHPCG